MNTPFGGLQVAANTTAFTVPAAGAKYTTGWAAIAAGQHGDNSVQESAVNSRLVLEPGVYFVQANFTLEGEFVSGTSGDAVGTITGQIFRGGVAVAGTRGKVGLEAEGEVDQLIFGGIVEITEAQKTAGTNYVEAFLSSGDASGNDVIVSEAQFNALRLH